jgi:uncharacterized protein YbjT (DUF2867 family)
MKIVVIGGTGLIGPKLVEKLRRDGHDPLAALEGSRVVVDVSDAPASALTEETAAAAAHHVMLSVIGADAANVAREEAVKAGLVPYTILRATQFFDSIVAIADDGPIRLPAVLVQPVAADDVAGALADIAVGSPLNDTIELAGPEAFRLDELALRVLRARHDRRQVTTAAVDLNARSLLPGDDARIASTRFDDWLSQSPITPNGRSRNVRH